MLRWSLANGFGILRDAEHRVWNAGHLNDVLEIAPECVLVASDGGGVWQLQAGFGLPLTSDWPSGDTTSLASLGAGWVLAGGSTDVGGGFLFASDPGAALPLWSWRPVAVPDDFGSVKSILVSGTHVVVATVPSWRTGLGGGLWSAPIPDPSDPAAFRWRLAAGLSATARVTGLAAGPDGSIVVGSDGTLFHGRWRRGLLTLTAGRVLGDAPPWMDFLVVASSPSHPEVCYAVSVDDTVRVMLSSDDGGHTWTQLDAIDRSTGATIVDHSQGGYTGALAVSPFDPGVVVFGSTLGPWVSVDGAANFFPSQLLSHDDKHRYRFTPSGRLYEACDGGVFFTDDLAGLRAGANQAGLTSMQSGLNQHLANLQFLGPTGVRDWWGRTNGSSAVPGVIAGGLQDNSDVWCLRWPGGSAMPWQTLPPGWGYDGQAVFFLDDDSVVFTYGNSISAHWSSSPAQLVADAGPITVRVGKPGINYDGGALPSGVMDIVRHPGWRNAAGEVLLAVSSAGNYAPPPGSPPGTPGPPYTPDVYGLFADATGIKHWDYLVSLPLADGLVVSAIASLSGHYLLVGVRGDDQVWRIDFDDGFTAHESRGLPADEGWTHYVPDIVVAQESPTVMAYAVYTSETVGEGNPASVLYRTENGIDWGQIATRGLPLEALYSLLFIDSPDGNLLSVATDTSVFTSEDAGATWVNDSAGLPFRPHCSDLCEVEQRDSRRFIYLATFGWSVWVAELPALKFADAKVRYHYPFLYPDDAPRPATLAPRLTDISRPPLNIDTATDRGTKTDRRLP